ncbi:MAG: hypothetical protein ABID63_04020 [Pseudomonadota bacterium]
MIADAVSRRLRQILIGVAAIWGVQACSLPGAGVDSGGDLKLLYAPFSLQNLPPFWHYENPQPGHFASDDPASPLFWEDIDGRIALGLRPAAGPVHLGRRTNIAILGSPYMAFDWRITGAAQAGDGELILGFRQQAVDSWTERDFGAGIPGVDHIIRIPVGASETGITSNTDQTSSWQRDFFDLPALHRRYWPDIDPLSVKLVWIGISVPRPASKHDKGVIYLSHILLSR